MDAPRADAPTRAYRCRREPSSATLTDGDFWARNWRSLDAPHAAVDARDGVERERSGKQHEVREDVPLLVD